MIGNFYHLHIYHNSLSRFLGPCNENEMQCNNGKCISQGLVCDGNMHCDDGSDENSFLCEYKYDAFFD